MFRGRVSECRRDVLDLSYVQQLRREPQVSCRRLQFVSQRRDYGVAHVVKAGDLHSAWHQAQHALETAGVGCYARF